jgi:hypothetical protein
MTLARWSCNEGVHSACRSAPRQLGPGQSRPKSSVHDVFDATCDRVRGRRKVCGVNRQNLRIGFDRKPNVYSSVATTASFRHA